MKLYYDDIEKFQIFSNKYLPLLARCGVSIHSFPRLQVYIGKQYPHFGRDQFGGKWPHVLWRGFMEDTLLYVPLFTLSDAKKEGWTEELYNRYMLTNPDTLPHEFGHVVHFNTLGNDNSEEWQTVWKLMGRTDKLDFTRGTSGAMEGQCPAYETFANYFADMVMGKATNIPLLQYLWHLMGVTVLVFKIGSDTYTRSGIVKQMARPLPIIEGTSYLPNRLLVEELQGVTLRDVVYVEQTKEIVVIGGNKNEMWEA